MFLRECEIIISEDGNVHKLGGGRGNGKERTKLESDILLLGSGSFRHEGLILDTRLNLIRLILVGLVSSGELVLLVLAHQIVHVALSFGQFHLVHTLAGVPMQESLPPEHDGELVAHATEQLLDGGGVTDESGRHGEAGRSDVTDRGLDVVGDPVNEHVARLLLELVEVVVNLLGGNATTEGDGGGQVTSGPGVGGGHHVLGVEHLLGELRNRELFVLLSVLGEERSKPDQEEVETREGDQVDSQLAEIRVELTRETERAGNTAHNLGDKTVQVTVGGGVQLQSLVANLVQGFVIDTENLISVLNKLVKRQGGVVRLDNGIGDLGGRNNREGAHHAVRVLFTDLRKEKCSETRTSSTTERVGQLETLQAVASLSFLPDNLQNVLDHLSTFGVVTLGPEKKARQEKKKKKNEVLK